MSERAPGGATAAERRVAVIAFDPGRNLGVAWLRADGRPERLAIISSADLEELAFPTGAVVVVGDGTGSRALVARLQELGHRPQLVDERDTSLRARELYFRDHPARGWQRLLPAGMRAPPEPIDGYAAYAIALRWLERSRA